MIDTNLLKDICIPDDCDISCADNEQVDLNAYD